jgi:glyoxylase-like metal-dependent hydrolase (beta-lactamase superfamily II)
VRIATIVTIMNNIDNLIVRGVPMTSTLVEFDDDSLAIIDTGMTDNPDLLEQLDDMGYKPSDFSLVLNTHLHPDHIGGNRHFTNARIFISRKELAYYQSLEGLRLASGQAAAVPKNVLNREMQKMRERYPVVELIGAPDQIEFLEDHPRLPWDIKLILAPGHSIDDRAVFLQGRTKNVLVAGDALYHRDLWRGPSLPDINLSEDLFRRSAQQLSEFQGIIIPGHDFAFDNATHAYLAANKFISI